MTDVNKPTYVELDEFCDEVALICAKREHDFMNFFELAVFEDARGQFFMPALRRYIDSDLVMSGNKDGYKTRERAMAVFGRCLDTINA